MHRLALLLVAFACAGSAPGVAATRPSPAVRRLVVVGINDTHGALLPAAAPRWTHGAAGGEIGGADWFGGYLDALRADAEEKGSAVVVVDAGDEFQGTLISNQFQGRSVTEVYDALGVTASAIGNHDFDFGLAVLQQRIAQAKYAILAANVFRKGTRERPGWARPSVLVNAGGVRVGIIGLATRETATVTNPVNVSGLDFAEGGPVAAQEADALRARGATVVVIAAHAGPFGPDHEIQRIARAVAGKVDAIVSGHQHAALGPPPMVVAGIPVVQSGSKLVSFSTVDLALDGEGRVRSFAVNQDALPRPGGPQAILHSWHGAPAVFRGRRVLPDARISAILGGYDEQVKALRETRIGETTVDLRKGGADDLLANLAADALRSGAGGGLRAQFALQNSGGLRITEIPAGPISFGQIFDLCPFDNEQVVLSLPAQTLRDALEAVLRAGKGPMRVSGLRYVIDWQRFGAAEDPRRAPAGAIVTRVVDEGGRPLCETKSCTRTACEAACAPGPFTVSLADFLANGGDGLSMLEDLPRQTGSVLTRDIIVSWVKEHRPLTPELLGALSTGKRPRWIQIGSPSRAQTGE
ncbi:MAG TPA: bifunctional UDP-sugar hydrolase/5'-nucleotidase [Myxococcales bacterium]|nr:bifunctional UDP-sugar hydrolase/5'-nucleotidase [Myxococcales bacterium]